MRYSLEYRGRCDRSIISEVFENDQYRLLEIDWTPRLIVDIGAHIGAFSVFAASRWTDCRVIAVEPDPDNFEMLVRNVDQLENAIPFRLALTDENVSEIRFQQVPDKVGSNSGGGSCYRDFHGRQEIVVPSMEAARFWCLARLSQCDILKLDCEGAELPILRSLENAGCLGGLRRIVGEWHAIALADYTTRRVQDELISILQATHLVSFFGQAIGSEGFFVATRADVS